MIARVLDGLILHSDAGLDPRIHILPNSDNKHFDGEHGPETPKHLWKGGSAQSSWQQLQGR